VKATSTPVVLVGFVLVAAVAFFRCGTDSKKEEDPAPTTTTLTLSTAFASAGCTASTCHGPNGTSGTGTNLVTYSEANTADQFRAAVRAGKGLMAPVSASAYSDANAANDHAYFKAQ